MLSALSQALWNGASIPSPRVHHLRGKLSHITQILYTCFAFMNERSSLLRKNVKVAPRIFLVDGFVAQTSASPGCASVAAMPVHPWRSPTGVAVEIG